MLSRSFLQYHPSQKNKAALIALLAAKIWIRENKRHQGCGEGRFILLGFFRWCWYLFDNLHSKTSSCNCCDESQCCQNCSILIIKWIAECLCCSICHSSLGIPNRSKSSSIIQVNSLGKYKNLWPERVYRPLIPTLVKIDFSSSPCCKISEGPKLVILKIFVKKCLLFFVNFSQYFFRHDWSDLWVIYFMLMIFV